MTFTALDERMPYRTADTREIREVHRSLRRFSRYLAAVTPVLRCGDLDTAEATRDVAAEVVDIVRRLHAAEQDGLWPALLGYLFAADLPADEVLRIEARAGELDRLVGAMAEAAERFGRSAAVHDRDALAVLVTRWYLELDAHLAGVEQRVLPLAEHFLTYGQWRLVVAAFAAGAEPGRLIPVGARSRRQRMRSARRFACVQSKLGAER
ncbi:MAG TPA: hypothetical protein VGH43_16895 [Jatrophihabitans sp.]|jgi:hypothetical protein